MSKKRHEIKEEELEGFKYFKVISRMLKRLHKAECQRDRDKFTQDKPVWNDNCV